ncbi:MAG: arylsulfatase A-like enzyme [Planctomycetota bacterium]|jgi:arylsulfatase A-like enzyme
MLRHLGLISLLFWLSACSEHTNSPVVPHGSVHYLFEQALVENDGAPWSTVLAPHLDGSNLWMTAKSVHADDWEPVENESEFEIARVRMRLPMAGGPYVHPVANEVSRAGLKLALPGQTRPGPNQLLLAGYDLMRAKANGAHSLSVSYPVERELLTKNFARLDEGRVEAQPVGMSNGTRRAAQAPAPVNYTYQVQVPSAGRLEFGVGVMHLALEVTQSGAALVPMHEEGVSFQVDLEREDGTRSVLWERTIHPGETMHFFDGQVDLTSWAGQTVRLHFQAESSSQMTPLVAWADPVVFGDSPDPRPNVLVILIDTLRADRVGCYGNERGLTPTLDSIAAAGILFADSMSAASWTLPSHASLFTSTYPSQHGVWDDQVLPAELPTIAEVLRDAGYRTAAFTEGGFMNVAHGFARGHSLHDSKERDCSITYDLAAQWINARTTPYYAFVHSYQVHSPHNPPAEFRERFVRPYSGELPPVIDSPRYKWGRGTALPNEKDASYVTDLYDAEVAYVDQQIGLMLERLRETGALDNTLVVITSDHGEEFFEHGASTHGFSLYQEQLHVPLILHWPGHFEGGLVIDHQVHSLDIAPTIAQAARVQAPASFVGSPLSLDAAQVARPMFVPMKTLMRSKPERSGEAAASLREGDLKFISYPTDLRKYDKHPNAVLFDLSKDPGEEHNILLDESAASWQLKLDKLYERYPLVESSEVAEYDPETQAELEKLGYTGGDD